MKLNLEMIANVLYKEKIFLHNKSSLPPYLNKEDIYQNKESLFQFLNNNWCLTTQEGTLSFYGLSDKQCIESVSKAFDIYYNWFEKIVYFLFEDNDIQSVIDETYTLLRNPMFYLDSDYRIIGITLQYLNDPKLDKHWSALLKNGHFSSEWLYYMGNRDNYTVKKILKTGEYYTERNFFEYNRYCDDVFVDGIRTGFLEVLEYETTLNFGHFCLLRKLTDLIKIKDKAHKKELSHYTTSKQIINILNGNIYDKKLVSYYLSLKGWQECDCYAVAVLSPTHSESKNLKGIINNIKIILEKQFNNKILCIEFSDKIILVLNQTLLNKDISISLSQIAQTEKLFCGVSNKFNGFFLLFDYYTQAISTINYGIKTKHDTTFFFFYDHAVNLIIGHNDLPANISMCHPDSIELMRYDNENNTDFLLTLISYIRNNCNLQKTASSLFIHRNTLIYRMQKIKSLLHYDLDNPYTKEYLMISYRIIQQNIK